MRKNILKKLATIAFTTVMAVCATVAMPTEAKADTTKDLYLTVDSEAEYSLGFWTGATGITVNGELAADGWTYAFEKVEDGVYKLNLTLADDFAGDGLSLSVNGEEKYKADTQWTGEAGAAAWNALVEALAGTDDVYITLDDENSTIVVESASGDGVAEENGDKEEDETTTAKTEKVTEAETEGAAEEEKDNNMTGVIVGVIAVIAVVVVIMVVKKKSDK